ncbi:MAG: FHA domain-containing protein [Armatimonadota bacterium]|nr:FHA domain-containing protein [Armatimonadota bacterium]
MIRFFLALCLLLTVGPVLAAPLTLTLPDTGAYSYWIQSKAGTIANLPVNISHKASVKIAAPVAAGDRVYVLDAHTGQVAAHSVSVGPEGTPTPITLTVTDFQPLNAPPAPTPTVAPVPPPVHAEAEPTGGGVGRILTGLFSLLLALGVAWVVYQLVKTRGEPLRLLAQRLGIDAPEPAPLVADEQETNVVYTPLKRAPEPIPEEAGLPAAVSVRAQRGPEISLPGVSALIGLQGIAAGGTFALTSGDLTIGRDGDNEIVLAENTVSRRHARLLRDGQGQFTVTDLGSANGVYVNGERVQRAILTHGDEVKVGDNYFRYQADKEQ